MAYLAKINSDPGSKADQYFETYFGSTGAPPGDGTYPVHKNYWGYDLLTDNPNIFMSSFIPQFCYYLSRGYQVKAGISAQPSQKSKGLGCASFG